MLGSDEVEVAHLFVSALGFAQMSTAAAPIKGKKFSKATLEASDRLLKAVKDKMLKEHGRIDVEDLRQRGYSEKTIARLRSL